MNCKNECPELFDLEVELEYYKNQHEIAEELLRRKQDEIKTLSDTIVRKNERIRNQTNVIRELDEKWQDAAEKVNLKANELDRLHKEIEETNQLNFDREMHNIEKISELVEEIENYKKFVEEMAIAAATAKPL